MDAYVYRAALYCGPCMVRQLIRAGKAAPAAADMEPARVLEQVTNAAGFACESDYDSDDLPKGPHANGGGEADAPQHCDACHVFLENSLTEDGRAYVRDALRNKRLRAGKVLKTWREFYSDEL